MISTSGQKIKKPSESASLSRLQLTTVVLELFLVGLWVCGVPPILADRGGGLFGEQASHARLKFPPPQVRLHGLFAVRMGQRGKYLAGRCCLRSSFESNRAVAVQA